MTVNGTEITQETILVTRTHFADIYRACINDAITGKVRVNDLNIYVKSKEARIPKIMAGESDHTLTFLQRALWLQTGNCVPILS